MKTLSLLLATLAITLPAFCAEEGGKPENVVSVVEVTVNADDNGQSPTSVKAFGALVLDQEAAKTLINNRELGGLFEHAFEQMAQGSEGNPLNEAKTKMAIGMSDEEFDAIKPLLQQVKQLRAQRARIDRRWQGSPTGDTALLPAVEKIRDSKTTLQALLDDPQANATEITSAIGRMRKALVDYEAVLAKAREDLRAVLKPRQEAVLIQDGTLN